MDFLHQNGINVPEWLSFSPDLSPIEHLWDELGRNPRDVRELRQAFEQEWIKIT